MSISAARIISADIVSSSKLVLNRFLLNSNLLMARSADALETGKQHNMLSICCKKHRPTSSSSSRVCFTSWQYVVTEFVCLFVCWLLNGTSALFRPLVPRIVHHKVQSMCIAPNIHCFLASFVKSSC